MYKKPNLSNFQLGNMIVLRNNKLCSLKNSPLYKREYIANFRLLLIYLQSSPVHGYINAEGLQSFKQFHLHTLFL